ncbi:XtrA/YqaO family protein [Jeotgalibacillus aurantiacus]|uniref:XtrA/YqaO family protein n=1 Tax=Jeotgalibacillus aurantiacus TaxID=2763266 RepID=UPI001D0B7DE4|nr:XtrA/YqaO family protein [Jeotgalibacillus aurantiacus]
MRMEKLEVGRDGCVKFDIMELNNCAVIIDNGKAKMVPLPEYGEARIITHQGKIKRVKFEEGEEF